MEEKIVVDNLVIYLERKSIKNMYIRIYPPDGRVKITVPKHTNIYTVRMFATSRIDWINKQRATILSRPIKVELQYVTGEYHYLWGIKYRLELVEGTTNRTTIEADTIILETKKGASKEQREHTVNEWYRGLLKEAIPSVLEKCSRVVGKSPKEWHVKNMRTRWGTCNPSKERIWLNLQLVKKPPECLDYVITHELVHLYVRNHDDRFKAYMDSFYPDWRKVKKLLNQE